MVDNASEKLFEVSISETPRALRDDCCASLRTEEEIISASKIALSKSLCAGDPIVASEERLKSFSSHFKVPYIR